MKLSTVSKWQIVMYSLLRTPQQIGLIAILIFITINQVAVEKVEVRALLYSQPSLKCLTTVVIVVIIRGSKISRARFVAAEPTSIINCLRPARLSSNVILFIIIQVINGQSKPPMKICNILDDIIMSVKKIDSIKFIYFKRFEMK